MSWSNFVWSCPVDSYTLSCPLIGMVAKRERFGPRAVIVAGLLLQLLGFVLIGPSPLLHVEHLGMGQMVAALIIFGIGESMSMTPVSSAASFRLIPAFTARAHVRAVDHECTRSSSHHVRR